MPFSKTTQKRTEAYWKSHYNNFLKPIIEQHHLKVSRSEPLRQNIVRDIIHSLVYSDIIVADLTDRNPNVYWELGVRQSFRHCSITIIDDSSKPSKKIPFNLSSKGVLTYSLLNLNEYSFLELFNKAISDCLVNPKRPDSEVLETITGRTSIYQVIHQEEIRQKIKGLICENEHNYAHYQTILKQVDENLQRKGIIKKPEKYLMFLRLNNPAINALLTERYIADEEIYTLANDMLTLINRINIELDTWYERSTSNVVEEWFNDFRRITPLIFEKYHKKLLELEEAASKYC
jgi:hypothetical protein